MKISAVSSFFLLFSLLNFHVMADENEESQLNQSLPTNQQPTLVTDGMNIIHPRPHIQLDGPAPKRSWPEVVGLPAEEAEKKIKADMPMVHVQVVLPDYFVTMDYNQRRVRIYVDSSGKVTKTPTTG